MFLVLLRLCIGWHFLYEGVYKLEKTGKGIQAWSAKGYLGVAEGPLRETFRGMLTDPDGLKSLNEAYLFPEWERRAMAYADRYHFDAATRTRIKKKILEMRNEARQYLTGDDDVTPVEAYAKPDEPSRAQIDIYRDKVADFRNAERNVRMSYEQKRLDAERGKLAKARATVTGPIKAMSADLDAFLLSLRSDLQPTENTRSAKLAAFLSSFCGLPWMDNLTMWGLAAIGFCLLAGLFSRTAALGGVVFLAMIYLSRPPWPWLPPNPMSGGHFMFIDKNTIELVALAALVFVPTGRWVGLDALIHRWVIGRQGRITEDTARQELARITA